MTLHSRIALLLNVKTSAALDQVEDPREIFAYAYGRQQAQLRAVKRGRLEVAAARRQLEREAERLRARADRLHEQARRAVRMQRDDLAHAALERKQATLVALRGLERQRADFERDEAELQRVDQQLGQRLEQFRVQRSVLSARYSAAAAQVTVGEALAGLAGDEETELSLAVERSEERVEQVTARALAIDELLGGDALAGPNPRDEVERELDALDITGAVDADLDALRRELADEQATDGGAA